MKMRTFVVALLINSTCVVAEDAKNEPKPEVATQRLVKDRTWVHIGDNNFDQQSNGASDLTLKAVGSSASFKITLDADALNQLKDDRWKSVELRGSVIGNDTGTHGNTSPSIVELNGKPIGKITKSGLFVIPIETKRVIAFGNKPLVFKVTSGQNSAKDFDDQELGLLEVWVSERAIPALKKPVVPASK